MRIAVIPCAEAVNESEAAAIDRLNRELQKTAVPSGIAPVGSPDDEWILLTNLAFSVTHQFQSDEIDIIAIGPPGVRPEGSHPRCSHPRRTSRKGFPLNHV